MDEKFVTIANFIMGPDPVSEAHLAKIKLEFEGIESFLVGENFVGTDWLASKFGSGIQLQVRSSDAARAIQVLGEKGKVSLQEDGEAEELFSPLCPKCHSDDVEFERFSRAVFYLGIFLFRVPLPFIRNMYRCNNCDHKWK